MLVQLIELYQSDMPKYQVWVRNGGGSDHAVLLRIFWHGTEAFAYATEVSTILNCGVQYGYEHVTLRLCTKDELWERMEE